MGVTWSQFAPPTPTLTEHNLPSQNGKVFIVTGGTSGVGLELCSILYHAGGKVYVAGRSQSNAERAISQIKSRPSATPGGELLFLETHLEDLSTIKAAVEQFTAAESRLDVLFNNAGVSQPPRDMLSAQGHELQMATNCLAHHLFTQLLLPILVRTAALPDVKPGAVRVVWTSSIVVDLLAPTGGFATSEIANPPSDTRVCYTNSKLGNWFLAAELARQVGHKGVLSVMQNPGNLKTTLLRHAPRIMEILVRPLLYHAKYGAYTELWSGLSEELGVEDGGGYVVPWGRKHPSPREDLINACRREEDGGTGLGKMFVEYCEKATERFR